MKHKKRKLPSKRSGDAPYLPFLLRQCALSACMTLPIMLPISLLSAWICSQTEDPLSLIPFLGIGLGFLSYLFCGILAARRVPGAFLASGILSGVILSLFFFLGNLIPGSTEASPLRAILLKLLGIVFSVVGAYLMKLRDPSRKHGRRTHRRP